MLSYRHAFHAGNHADILKHFALCAVLEKLQAKNKSFSVFDTHAGAGRGSQYFGHRLRCQRLQGQPGKPHQAHAGHRPIILHAKPKPLI